MSKGKKSQTKPGVYPRARTVKEWRPPTAGDMMQKYLVGQRKQDQLRKRLNKSATARRKKEERKALIEKQGFPGPACNFLSADHDHTCPERHLILPRETATRLLRRLGGMSSSGRGRKVVLEQGKNKIVLHREGLAEPTTSVQMRYERWADEKEDEKEDSDASDESDESEEEEEEEEEQPATTGTQLNDSGSSGGSDSLVKMEPESSEWSSRPLSPREREGLPPVKVKHQEDLAAVKREPLDD